MTPDDLSKHPVISHDQWLAARTKLLAKEKELTRAKDELTRLRRALPWERVEKSYEVEGPDGHMLDLVTKGRDEDPDDPQSWVRYHDRYRD